MYGDIAHCDAGVCSEYGVGVDGYGVCCIVAWNTVLATGRPVGLHRGVYDTNCCYTSLFYLI